MAHRTSALLLAAAIITVATAATVNKTATFGLPSQFLSPHNAIRSPLKLTPLTWDLQLMQYAESYALRRRSDCALVHSGGPYGENIFWGSGSGWSPAQAVAAWGGEGRWYSIKANTCVVGRECGHYTQIVWRSTRRIGCATVNCVGGRGQFMVCEYDPPGNYIGERPY
ncbi:pathogenesis-related protein PR-1-like [Dendrobium catenatum]|uniref:Pathogenesis-related protein PR-1 n=1 Tax=Dendrobium catenatum TaxID=906689 RepID=A0A2I0VA62_9ASPA|nr:pathogenesis-related protein PR-1-like [Dendrobium catenatum]PKU60290.1 Pathogenesis-related protein PR-1 [Dendrobium catenatum]